VTQFSDERGAELRELFFETAQELLQVLNDDALKLEKHPEDVETIRSIRRTVHTLKGDAAACGFHQLSELAHELEDALVPEIASHSSLAEVAFAAADLFGAMLTAHRRRAKLPSAEPLRKLIRELAHAPKTQAPRKKKKNTVHDAAPAGWTEYEKLAIRTALRRGRRVFQVRVRLDPLCAMPIAARQLVLNALAAVGEVLAALPESNSPQAAKQMQFMLASERTAEQVAAACRIPTVVIDANVQAVKGSGQAKAAAQAAERASTANPEPADAKAAPQMQTAETEAGAPVAATEPESPGGAHTSAGAENILRVDAERIDNVLNLVGELIIGKSMLQQALNEFSRRYPRDAVRSSLADALAFQGRVLNDLQRSVMKVRMVPVEQLFRRFPRMVRDVAKQCSKEVNLVISGQDTDLDKGLLDAIAEPLTHLVRNAVSHGVESSEERARHGKPGSGTIRLSAYHQGNQVIVEVTDDGCGVDTARVKAKAIEQKIVSAEEAAALSEADALALVFRPGFSTAREITEISGRGVGLDVVQSVVQRLKGTVEIVTHVGEGTTFRLKLPLTLAIIKALLFRVEERLYAIPLNAVAEIARALEADLHQVDNYEVLQLRHQVLQLVRLGRPQTDLQRSQAKVFVLVIAVGERKLGLIVDGLEGEEELVIKAVDHQTVATDLVGGASILGDGRVVLILNLAAVVERAVKARGNGAGKTAAGLLLSHADRVRTAQAPAEVGS
jgi:two-component system, chemotaxis family, sensor kinase CheA